MTSLLVDTSVVIKWFHSTGEAEVAEARSLLAAHQSGEIDAHILDLAVYEVGNVLVRALRWSSSEVADQLDDLLAICGEPLALTADWLRQAAFLAGEHQLSFYDAAWAAAARGLGVSLISADRRLLSVGLAESAGDAVGRLRLAPS